jgi:hypothetical protein
VPATLVAAGPAQVGTFSVAGAQATDFPKQADDCSGATSAAGDACEVWVRFAPGAPGTRTAVLRIPAGGTTHEVDLQGFADGGRTRVVMHSDDGDTIGGGLDHSYTYPDSDIGARARPGQVSFSVDHVNGDWWYADFAPPSGEELVVGRTYQAERSPFHEGDEAGMSVSGNGRGCSDLSGTFTVTELRLDAEGRTKSVGVEFEQHCQYRDGALRGTWEFRVGDDTPWRRG